MILETSAGKFKLSADTNAAPIQVCISTGDRSGIERIDADDLPDLIYAATRMQTKIEAEEANRKLRQKA